MSQIRTALLLLVTLFLVNMFAPWARAQTQTGSFSGTGTFNFEKRAEKREATRWTLAEWLEQRDRSRMMDMWLSMNSPSPFEFMVGGSYLATKTKNDTPASIEDSFGSYEGELRGYAQFVGLTAEYSNNTQEHLNDLSGMLNIRLLGNSLQNSSFTISLGQRARTFEASGETVSQRNVFSQAAMQLYMAKYFGIDAHYRYYEPSMNDTVGDSIGGSQKEAGLFIDFKAVRVFGAWYQDTQTNKNDLGQTNTIREGVKSGLKIFY